VARGKPQVLRVIVIKPGTYFPRTACTIFTAAEGKRQDKQLSLYFSKLGLSGASDLCIIRLSSDLDLLGAQNGAWVETVGYLRQLCVDTPPA
jgi:hypothetical protein